MTLASPSSHGALKAILGLAVLGVLAVGAPARASSHTDVSLSLTLSPLTPAKLVQSFQQDAIHDQAAIYRAIAPTDRLRVPMMSLSTTSGGIQMSVTVDASADKALALTRPLRAALKHLADATLPAQNRFAYHLDGPTLANPPFAFPIRRLGLVLSGLAILLLALLALRRRHATVQNIALPHHFGLPVLGVLKDPRTELSEACADLAFVLKQGFPAGKKLAIVGLDGLETRPLQTCLRVMLDPDLWQFPETTGGDTVILALVPAHGASASQVRKQLRKLTSVAGLVLVGASSRDETAYQIRLLGSRLMELTQ